MLDGIFGEVPAPIRETLERVKASGRHLLGLINDVLDLSKMEAGQLTLSLGEYAMGDVVQAVVSSVEALAAATNLAFRVDVAADLPLGRWDYGAIGTVTNLAAGLCGEAAGGQILVSSRVAGLLEGSVEFAEVGRLTLKAVSRPIPTLRVGWDPR